MFLHFFEGVGVMFLFAYVITVSLIYKAMHQQTQERLDCVCACNKCSCIYSVSSTCIVFDLVSVGCMWSLVQHMCVIKHNVIQYYGPQAHCQLANVGKHVARAPVNIAHHMSQESGQET